MARNKVRPASKTTASSTSSRPGNASARLPSSLKPPPAALEPLLPYLSPSHIHVLHTDTFPSQHKRNVFLVPLALNTLLALLLAWRLYLALPTYANYLGAIFAPSAANATSPVAGDVGRGFTTAAKEVLKRMGTLALDYALFAWVGVWPAGFFLGILNGDKRGSDEDARGPGSPFLYRLLSVRGFYDAEIVVRRSRRGWDTVLAGLENGDDESGERRMSAREDKKTPAQILASEQDDDGAGRLARNKVADATDEEYVCARSGMAMVGPDWEVDYEAMGVVEELIRAPPPLTSQGDESEASRQTVPSRPQRCAAFDRWCLVYHRPETTPPATHKQPPSQQTEASEPAPTSSSSGWLIYTPAWTRAASSSEEDTRRAELQAMKDRLTALGKESLFFRWVEMVADASAQQEQEQQQQQPGAPGPGDASAALTQRAKEMFEREGVDFDAVARPGKMGGPQRGGVSW